MGNPYESDRYLYEYLLFHFGTAGQFGHPSSLPASALQFAQRSVSETLDRKKPFTRALDLGCAVGGASFELSKYGAEVIGIDFSYRFIQAAQSLQQYGRHEVQIAEEGDTVRLDQVRLDPSVQPERVRFHQGDALDLPRDLGQFDVVLLANLIDRLPTPRRFLQKLPDLVLTGGQLIITSPYTWLETFTPKEEWLGGYEEKGQNVQTLSTLRTLLEPHFEFRGASDLPFLIREHARKFQWSVAEASRWTRR